MIFGLRWRATATLDNPPRQIITTSPVRIKLIKKIPGCLKTLSSHAALPINIGWIFLFTPKIPHTTPEIDKSRYFKNKFYFFLHYFFHVDFRLG
jgi:hypothetical protein